MRYPLVIAALLLCPLVLFAQTSTPATVFHSNGAFAQFLTITPDGLEIIVQVQRGTDSSGNASTFLIYDTFGPVTDGFVDTFASGVIPDSAFQGGDPAHLSLNVDTSQLTGFSSTSCTLSNIDFSFTCGPGSVGLIQLDWQQDSFSSTHTVSNVQQTFAQFMSQQHTVADTASALATGSFLGVTINSASGQAGVNHNSTLQIVKLQ
jgi:hypothetical protein